MRTFTFLIYVSIWAFLPPLVPAEDRCLTNYPEVLPKAYFHYAGKSLNVTIQMSNRVTHQVTTNIFSIFLKEVLGFAKVQIVPEDDNFEAEHVLKNLEDTTHVIPKVMVNLEVWVPPDYNPWSIQLVKEYGIVAPPGRFGWFIPRVLDKPLKKFNNDWDFDVNEVHWTFFRNRTTAAAFDIEIGAVRIFEKYSLINNDTYECDEPYCEKGIFIPDQCKGNQSCALLLTSHFNNTKFVVDHINQLNLYVKVYWVGSNLNNVLTTLTTHYPKLENETKSIVFLHWTPSELVRREKDFISVAFQHCGLVNTTTDVGCKYEMHRIAKFAWSKIENFAGRLHEVLRVFSFTKAQYLSLLDDYMNSGKNKSVTKVACNWMKNNVPIWSGWSHDTSTNLYIGGIFPISFSSYHGPAIARAAYVGVAAINKNRTILPNYNLKLVITDGKCQAANVMKNFIDFVKEKYYDNLIGVLGPACSETVEPLAGVSKYYRIMVISYSAEGASFSNRDKYPFFFRTIGENKHYKHVYLELFKTFDWSRVATLTEDGQKYTEYISIMQEDLEKHNIKFITNKKFPRERETTVMTSYLEDLKSKRARIIIADVVDDVARSIMCEASKLQMTSADGYVWFLPIWLNKTWYDTDHFNSKNENISCTTAEMIKSIQGYFSMTHAYYAPDDDIMQENITVGEWRKKNRGLNSNYAGFAYDAVWTYALAIDKLSRTDPEALSDIHSANTTKKLVKLVEATDFHGVSGRIKFRGGPSRFSVINILEWYNNESHIIGRFYPNLTDDRPEILGGKLQINRTAIRWFTPDGTRPDDGASYDSDCALQGLARLFNVSCSSAIVILNIFLIMLILGLIAGVTFYMKRKYEERIQYTQKYEQYMRSLGLRFDLSASTDLDKWEIPREHVVINRKLGEGAFGTVYGGEANLPNHGWVAIAVKTLKVGSSTEEKLDFLSEAEVMKRFDHKNIIKLLGVCTKEEPVYTVMEYMLYGDLKTFLLARRHLVKINSKEAEEVSPSKLTSMALDVARGLSYLAELKYVHRDVASRNCLVNGQRVVKLGDFGMTRPTFENDYYKFNRKGMLPVRWMAPESLSQGVFSPASDVWSFGVLLYEIVTFGSFPFQGKSNAQVLEMVKAGGCLEVPIGAKPNLEGLMKNCWARDAKARPHPSVIVDYLANNPRFLTPCLDAPLTLVQLDEDQIDIHFPSDSRKYSASFTKASSSQGGAAPSGLGQSGSGFSDEITIDPEGEVLLDCGAKEPLLGPAKSSASLLSFGKYVTLQQSRTSPGTGDDQDDEQEARSPKGSPSKSISTTKI